MSFRNATLKDEINDFVFLVLGGGSRRQSTVRPEGESTYSLQGSMHAAHLRDSPRPSQRKLVRAPLYLQNDSYSTLEHHMETEGEAADNVSNGADHYDTSDQTEFIRKPLAMVRPRQKLISITGSEDCARFREALEFNLRESRSLDPFPVTMRKRIDPIQKITNLWVKRSSRSLDGRGHTHDVAMISNDPNCGSTNGGVGREMMTPECNQIVPYKHLNNNCNGSVGIEDPNCPLLFRQASLNSPHDETMMHTKRWRSLEAIGAGVDDYMQSKKTLNRNSIKSWLVGLFHGNGFRSSNASLRKVGVMPTGVRGIGGFGELPPPPEHESIV